jgi:hypothetical protein
VTGCLDDLVSDFSRFHGIRDVSVLGSRAFLRLARRLEFYGGIMTLRASAGHEAPAAGPAQPAPARRVPQRYDTTSPHAHNARTAQSAPPATGALLQGMAAQLGGGWISYRTVKAGEVTPPDG